MLSYKKKINSDGGERKREMRDCEISLLLFRFLVCRKCRMLKGGEIIIQKTGFYLYNQNIILYRKWTLDN